MFYNHMDSMGKFVKILIKLRIGSFKGALLMPPFQWLVRWATAQQEISWQEEPVAACRDRSGI